MNYFDDARSDRLVHPGHEPPIVSSPLESARSYEQPQVSYPQYIHVPNKQCCGCFTIKLGMQMVALFDILLAVGALNYTLYSYIMR